jgi:hypothetical protein
MEPMKYGILLYYWILQVSRIPTVYHLLFLDLQIKRYEFCKIGIKFGLNFQFEFLFKPEADARRDLIGQYRFVRIGDAGRWI